MACTNDLTPIIIMISIQAPILLGVLVTWLNLRISQAKQKAGNETLVTKVDGLTTIVVNGFHSPPNVLVTAPATAAPTAAPQALPPIGPPGGPPAAA